LYAALEEFEELDFVYFGGVQDETLVQERNNFSAEQVL